MVKQIKENYEEDNKKTQSLIHKMISLGSTKIFRHSIQKVPDKDGKVAVEDKMKYYPEVLSYVQLAETVKGINEADFSAIEQQPSIIQIIDSQFVMTKWVYLMKFYIFLIFMGFMLKFLQDHKNAKRNYELGLSCVILFINVVVWECLTIKCEGFNYFKDYWNWIDISLVGTVGFYAHQVLSNQQTDFNEPYIKLLEILIVFLSFMKVFELLRVTEQFGKNINLFFKSIWDMRYYMAFFIAWIIQFKILYELLGVEMHGWKLIYVSWEIGIGAGNKPKSPLVNKYNILMLNIVWILN